MALRRLWVPIALCCLVGLAACEDDPAPMVTAGSPAIPTVGEPCTSRCDSGFVCERQGPFAGVCSAGCNNDAACGLLAPGAVCVTGAHLKCARRCDTTDDCPMGTACTTIERRNVCTASAAAAAAQQMP